MQATKSNTEKKQKQREFHTSLGPIFKDGFVNRRVRSSAAAAEGRGDTKKTSFSSTCYICLGGAFVTILIFPLNYVSEVVACPHRSSLIVTLFPVHVHLCIQSTFLEWVGLPHCSTWQPDNSRGAMTSVTFCPNDSL